MGMCPRCSLADALVGDEPTPVERGAEAGAAASRSILAPSGDSGGSRPPAGPETRRRGAFARWGVALFFVVAAVYVLCRLIWISQHPRPNIILTEELQVVFNRENMGLVTDARLIEVNGTSVTTRDEARAAYDLDKSHLTRLVFRQGSSVGAPTASYVWARIPELLEFDVSPDGQLVLPGGVSLADFGLETEPTVTAISGVPLADIDGRPMDVPPKPGETMTFLPISVLTPEGPRELVAQRNYVDIVDWAKYAAGVGLGVIGIFVFWLRPDSRSAAGFLFFCVYCGLLWMTRSMEFWYRFAPENMVYYVLQTLLPFATAILLFTFTPLRLLNIDTRRWIAAGAALGLALLVGNAILAPRYAAYGILTTNGFRVWATMMLVILLVSFPLNLWMRLGGVQLSATDRLRTRILGASILISFLLPTLYAFLLTLIDVSTGTSVSYKVFSEISVLMFPFLIGYAVVRHNLLRLNELAREGLLLGLLLAGVSLLYVAITTATIPLAEQFLPETENWVRPLAFAVVLAFVTPVHQRARHWVEKRFSRVPFEFDSFTEAIAKAEQTANSPFELAQAVVTEVARLLKSKRVAFLSRYPGHERWVLSAMIPLPRTGNTTDSCQSLLALLEQEKHELYRDEIVDNLDYRHLKQEALEGFVSLEATAIFPLMSRGSVIGALAVGEKSTGGNFSMPELRALRRIGQHVAGVLFNLMGKQIAEGSRRIVDIYPNFPEKIGSYTIERVLGEGGMSYVYLGESRGPRYAIKVPNRMIQASPVLMERFQREASAIQQLRHLNIVSVREVGWMGPEPFMVLEYFENGSLDDEVKRNGPLTERAALYVVSDVATGLKFAQEHGVIHRDIKPKNLFRSANGIVKIGDFGLARLSDMSSITATGEFFGTADYLSPEIVEGEVATWHADQYALGVTLFFLLTGQVPFKAATAQAKVYRRLNEPPPDPRSIRPEISERASAMTQRLMARTPAERFESYALLIENVERVTGPALRHAPDGKPVPM